MVLRGQPLLQKNHREQRRHGKVQTFGVEGQNGAQKAADRRTGDPVAMVKHRHQQPELPGIRLLRHRGAHQGIGLVGEGEDQVGLLFSRVLIPVQHAQPVEKVPGIDHQRHQGRGDQAGAAGDQIQRGILQRSGVDTQGHEERPEKPVAPILQQHAEARTEDQIPRHHGKACAKSQTRGFCVHERVSFPGECNTIITQNRAVWNPNFVTLNR